MKYYIVDVTKDQKHPIYFNKLDEVITHLEGACQRLHNLSRAKYMQNLTELGYSSDEPTGKTFIEAMSETFNIGMVKDNRLMKCNIFEATHYSKYRTEMGD